MDQIYDAALTFPVNYDLLQVTQVEGVGESIEKDYFFASQTLLSVQGRMAEIDGLFDFDKILESVGIFSFSQQFGCLLGPVLDHDVGVRLIECLICDHL